ncbi:MAG: hypothetical protein U9O64_02315, partial [Campylobacterota bacterium]|nr:hypothetical protein [Campylobacterota bacterium]
MKHLYLENGTYFFKRKIPLTKKNFSTSLKTGNLETAQYILATIIPKINLIFDFCKAQNMTEEEQFDLMTKIIRSYVKEAWIENGKLEKLRHKAFTTITKKGKKRDGGHPKAIEKKLLPFVQDCIYDIEGDEANKLVEEILQRSNISKEDIEKFDDYYTFKTELLKAEYELLYCDKGRNEETLV